MLLRVHSLASSRAQLPSCKLGARPHQPRRPPAQRRAPVAAAMVQYLEGQRTSARGHKLFTTTFLPDAAAGPPLAVLCFHHGLGEHIGRYTAVFERFAEQGIAVYSGDSVGHGKSEGHRALVESYTQKVDEFVAFCDYAVQDVQERYPGSPPPPAFIAGHSLGGLIATLVAHRDQERWAGLLSCSPALDVELTPILRVQAAMGNLLAAVVPKARIVPAVDPAGLNPDPKAVQEYMADPLNTVGNMPARTANEILKAMRWLRPHWSDFRLPLYVHHGELDTVTSVLGSQAFFAAAASSDKTLKLVPSGLHELLFSADVSDGLVAGMIDWIKQHASASGGAAKM